MPQWKYLSYLIDENTPAYGGEHAFYSKHDKDMKKGDSCNTSSWSMSNHIGTHIDFPKHFNIDGKTVDHYPADFWVLDKIKLIEVNNVQPGHILSEDDILSDDIPSNTQLLLIKTGFSMFRAENAYWDNNPGLNPSLSPVLKNSFPDLRILGIDTISISSFTNRHLGRKAHKAFLDNIEPILLIEDLDLSKIDTKMIFKKVIVLPMRVHGADGSPCTVIGEIEYV